MLGAGRPLAHSSYVLSDINGRIFYVITIPRIILI
jgi:hypothetical protein